MLFLPAGAIVDSFMAFCNMISQNILLLIGKQVDMKNRIDILRKKLESINLKSMIVTNEKNIYYLSRNRC